MRTVQCAVCKFQFFTAGQSCCLQSLSCTVQKAKDHNAHTCTVVSDPCLPIYHQIIFTFVVFHSVPGLLFLSIGVLGNLLYSLRKNMGRNGRCFSMIMFLLCFTSGIGHTIRLVQGQKTWCIAKPSTDEGTLIANLNYACSQVDCSVLQKGKPCFNPDNLISHASVAMNLYYQSRGRNAWNCNFKNAAVVVLTDPSYGGCMFA